MLFGNPIITLLVVIVGILIILKVTKKTVKLAVTIAIIYIALKYFGIL